MIEEAHSEDADAADLQQVSAGGLTKLEAENETDVSATVVARPSAGSSPRAT